MLANVVCGRYDGNDVIEITVDESEFKDHNIKLEKPYYRGDDGLYNKRYSDLWTRELVENIYIDADVEIDNFTIVEYNSLVIEYIESKYEGMYVQWLENELMNIRNHLN